MTVQEIDRIECTIRHIKTATDVDPWAAEIAVDAMRKQIPQKPCVSIDVTNNNLRNLYCPMCGTRIGMWNKRLRAIDMHNNTNSNICGKCGQAVDTDFERWEE